MSNNDPSRKETPLKDHIRICFVASRFSPLVGGAETRTEKQARQLQALGEQVTIVTLRQEKHWKRTEIVDGLPVVRVGHIFTRHGLLRLGRLGHLATDVAVFLTLLRLRRHYDVLHACQIGTLATVTALVGKVTHTPVVVSIPTTGPSKRQREAVLMADELLLSKNDLTVDFHEAVAGDISYLAQNALGGEVMMNALKHSDAWYQIFSRRSSPYLASLGFPESKMVYIPNGVDTQVFRPDEQRRPDPALPQRQIICVSRLHYAKGIDVLLHAWSRMMRAPAEWRTHLKPQLSIVGDGDIRPQVERIAAALGMQDSVEFLGVRKDIVERLQCAWGFVLPSRWEGMPNALLEAMACGLPCIATRVSGSEDIVNPGVNALMVEPEEPTEMAQALRLLIEDTPLALRLGQEARATMLQEYQLKTIVERCLDLYRTLLSQRLCCKE